MSLDFLMEYWNKNEESLREKYNVIDLVDFIMLYEDGKIEL